MNPSTPSPAEFCRALLDALDASEGRRKRRQRNTTPDAIGMVVKRELLERACRDDPASESFEAWLINYCTANSSTTALGTLRATALQVHEEWRLANQLPQFREWLAQGAPSGDHI